MFTKSKGFLIHKEETKTNFTKVPNEIFTQPLDVYSKMILIYLHSKTPDFIHYETVIATKTGVHRNTVSRRIPMLVEKGYLVRTGNGYKLMHLPATLTAPTSDINNAPDSTSCAPDSTNNAPTSDINCTSQVHYKDRLLTKTTLLRGENVTTSETKDLNLEPELQSDDLGFDLLNPQIKIEMVPHHLTLNQKPNNMTTEQLFEFLNDEHTRKHLWLHYRKLGMSEEKLQKEGLQIFKRLYEAKNAKVWAREFEITDRVKKGFFNILETDWLRLALLMEITNECSDAFVLHPIELFTSDNERKHRMIYDLAVMKELQPKPVEEFGV